nr:MAG TPA: hypothetical protein [Caudoviricetes sp.]DAS98451.1 MAG TPA: hypothetical protein [Caudoviricetes sp.]DAY25664.1 MAG TPA: hypothetical protein [Caudoviricetes sp.]
MLKSINLQLIFYAFWSKKSRKMWRNPPLTA